jgi:Ca2+-binding EF-hand superfamily protein
MKMVQKTLIAGLALGATTAMLLLPMAAVANGKAPGGAGGRATERDRPGFEALDADGDGTLTVAEMLAFGASKFAQSDSNGDGVISADEYGAAAVARAAARAAERYARMLEWRDLDGDGALSPAEMTDNRGEKLFMRLDGNRDGVVTAEEFAKALERGQRGQRGQRGRPGAGPKGDHPRGGN